MKTVGRVTVYVKTIGKGMWLLVLVGGLTALAVGVPGRASAQQASITLKNSHNELCNANNTEWTLEKTTSTPTVTGDSTISWPVTATQGATSPNMLTVNGVITVTNTGTAPATIGNIVVNLQKPRTGPNTGDCKNVPWVSAVANVAAATGGDDATEANIVTAASREVAGCSAAQGASNYSVSGAQGTFSETPGVSGKLEFKDENDNSVFSLNPQASLAPGASITLLYTATFNNTILGLPVGSQVRTEALVTFGNAG